MFGVCAHHCNGADMAEALRMKPADNAFGVAAASRLLVEQVPAFI